LGLNIDRDHFEEDDYARFSQRLREDIRALAELFSRECFGIGAPSLGAEIEMSMVGATCGPRAINEREAADQLHLPIQLKPLVARPIHRLHFTETLRLLHLPTERSTLPIYGSSFCCG
jgi:hypothetical protein